MEGMYREEGNRNKHSPESGVIENFQGKDFSKLRHTWSAQWITHPTAPTMEYGVFLFRRSFHIADLPKSFIIHISADNRYRLFVNGKYVCFGPAVGDLEHYKYDTLDIISYLRQGENLIAVEVVNFGEFRRAAQLTFQTALILQAEYGNPRIDTGTGGWKVIRNDAYKDIPFLPSDLNAYYCAGPGDELNGELYPWGWRQLNFDDKKWLTPRSATVEFAVGRGFLYGGVWFLVPRNIPFMEEKTKPFRRIVRYSGIEISENFIDCEKSIVVPSAEKVSLLFDNGVHTVAFPQLSVSGGKGAKIKITYAEALLKKNSGSKSDGHFSLENQKGNRDEIEGKEIFGVYDIFFPDGGNNRIFRPLWKRTYRFIQLDIENASQELIIQNFTSGFMGYPFKEAASFSSDDPILDEMWETAWRTLRNGADEIYQDTPYYEQMQYVGDTRLSALTSVYVSGDDRLMRNAIEQFDNSRIAEGLTQSRYPSYIKQIITPFSLFWIGMIYDHYLYQGDFKFIYRFLRGIRGVLEWFENYFDEFGLIAAAEWWNFTDWVEEFPNGIPPNADKGHSANISMQYLYALNLSIELFEHFNWQSEVYKFKNIYKNLKRALYENCYDKERNLFAETSQKKIFTIHTNSMAVLADAVEKDKQRLLMKNLLSSNDIVDATLYFKFYFFRALQKTGLGDEYLNQLSPWKEMLDIGLTTFAENGPESRSDCHPWSSTPCFDLLHTVAGVYPAEPGFKIVNIEPNFGYLKKISAKIPTPFGLVAVNLEKIDNRIRGDVFLPENGKGVLKWEGKEFILSQGRQTVNL